MCLFGCIGFQLWHTGSSLCRCEVFCCSAQVLQPWSLGSRAWRSSGLWRVASRVWAPAVWACRLSSCSTWAQLFWGMWDPSSPTRDWTPIPSVATWTVNHWATWEVPHGQILNWSAKEKGMKRKLPSFYMFHLFGQNISISSSSSDAKHCSKFRISSCCANVFIGSQMGLSGDTVSTALPVIWLVKPWKIHNLLILYLHVSFCLQTASSHLSSSLLSNTSLKTA